MANSELRIRTRWLTALLAIWVACSVPAQAQISKHAQADILTAEIASALKRKNASAALAAIGRYKALGLEVPLAIRFKEAQLAALVKDYQRAGEALETYLKLAPQSDADYRSAISLHSTINTNVSLTKDAYGQGWSAIYRQDPQGAVESFSIAHEISPGSAQILVMRANHYRPLGRTSEAILDYTAAIALDSGNVEARRGRATAYFYALRFPEALSDIHQAMAINKSDYDTMSTSCVMKAAANIQVDSAYSDCSAAMKLDAYPGLAQFGRGILSLRRGNYSAAIQDFKKCLDTTTCLNGDAWFALALAQARSGDAAASQLSLSLAAKQHRPLKKIFEMTGLK